MKTENKVELFQTMLTSKLDGIRAEAAESYTRQAISAANNMPGSGLSCAANLVEAACRYNVAERVTRAVVFASCGDSFEFASMTESKKQKIEDAVVADLEKHIERMKEHVQFLRNYTRASIEDVTNTAHRLHGYVNVIGD